MSNKNLSLLFTGQGSQFADMGIDFITKYEWVKERYSISSKILGYDLIQAQRDPRLLNLTQYSQPMIFVFSSIIIDLCKDYLHKNFSKIILAGHSLGEYCAMYFAETFNGINLPNGLCSINSITLSLIPHITTCLSEFILAM